MSEDRLQKILARAGVASRRASEELIRAGRVTVNGQVATLGDKADSDQDAIKVDGKRLQPPPSEHRYLLLNKPPGVMSTVNDPEGRPTVLELVPPALRKALVPVGRLDFQTEGLLLLTNDGELAHRVAHPRYGCSKLYEVKVKGRPAEKDLDRLRAGVRIEGRRTAPCRIAAHRPPAGGREAETNTWWQVELSEGRTRQIREMFFRIGAPVIRLRRVAVGPIRDDSLPPGGLRELTTAEVERLRRATRKVKRNPRRGEPPAGAKGGRDRSSSRGAGARGKGKRGSGKGPRGGRGKGSR
jgi:pseudouridine synthase